MNLSKTLLLLYSISNPCKYLMTSNLGKFSISCKVLIMGNPYSSTEIPLGNVIKWK